MTRERFTTGLLLAVFLVSSLWVAGRADGAECTKAKLTTYNAPTQNGMRIDSCVQGEGWALFSPEQAIVPERCYPVEQDHISGAFCRAKGHRGTPRRTTVVEPHVGNHAIWTYQRHTDPGKGTWTQVAGATAIKKIICEDQVPSTDCFETKTFDNPTQNSMRIDKCVQGADWGMFDPQRCDSTRVKTAADAFCRGKGYTESTSRPTVLHAGNHAIWTYKKGGDPKKGSWTQVGGADALSKVTCQRPRP
jgi:hypothetical protein